MILYRITVFLEKLQSFGITGNVLKWIKAFLSGRHQRVVVNGTFSKWKPVLSGIPQGSVLVPVLFIMFNVLKCKYVQYGLVKFDFNYQMRDNIGNISSLAKDTEEKDLGILFQDNLKLDKQILGSVCKANKILGLIKRSFVHMDCDLLMKLYKALVRPILDYRNVIWYPYTKKNKKLI